MRTDFWGSSTAHATFGLKNETETPTSAAVPRQILSYEFTSIVNSYDSMKKAKLIF